MFTEIVAFKLCKKPYHSKKREGDFAVAGYIRNHKPSSGKYSPVAKPNKRNSFLHKSFSYMG